MKNSVKFNQLNRHANITYAISTLYDGNMSFRWGEKEEVIAARQKFLGRNNLSLSDCVVMEVAHSTDISLVEQNFRGRGTRQIDNAIKVDALITREPKTALFLLTADCLPIIFFDPVSNALALAHLGWRGTNDHLSPKIVQSLVKNFLSEPKDILVAIGPGIHKESYKFSNPVQKSLPEWRPYLSNLDNNQTGIDIVGYNIDQLQDCGILKPNIQISDIDTARSPDFFSHYRSTQTGEPEGRFATVVSLK